MVHKTAADVVRNPAAMVDLAGVVAPAKRVILVDALPRRAIRVAAMKVMAAPAQAATPAAPNAAITMAHAPHRLRTAITAVARDFQPQNRNAGSNRPQAVQLPQLANGLRVMARAGRVDVAAGAAAAQPNRCHHC